MTWLSFLKPTTIAELRSTICATMTSLTQKYSLWLKERLKLLTFLSWTTIQGQFPRSLNLSLIKYSTWRMTHKAWLPYIAKLARVGLVLQSARTWSSTKQLNPHTMPSLCLIREEPQMAKVFRSQVRFATCNTLSTFSKPVSNHHSLRLWLPTQSTQSASTFYSNLTVDWRSQVFV